MVDPLEKRLPLPRKLMRALPLAGVGLVAGILLLLAATMLSPSADTLTVATPPQWVPLCVLLTAGAIWFRWRELRES